MAEASIDPVAHTVAEVKADTLGDTLANVMGEALFHALAATRAEVEAEELYVLKPYAEAKTLNEVEGVALVYTQDHKFSQVQA